MLPYCDDSRHTVIVLFGFPNLTIRPFLPMITAYRHYMLLSVVTLYLSVQCWNFIHTNHDAISPCSPGQVPHVALTRLMWLFGICYDSHYCNIHGNGSIIKTNKYCRWFTIYLTVLYGYSNGVFCLQFIMFSYVNEMFCNLYPMGSLIKENNNMCRNMV